MTRNFVAPAEANATIPSPVPKSRPVPVHPQILGGLML
jgi:hypothetical protein